MHDGAVIIHKGRIQAARCILPVSENDEIPAAFGLRHRAAIGLSEVADAIVLVVSEETGQISLVRSGELLHNLSTQELRSKLNLYLFEEDEMEKKEVTPEVA
jgi:diadenylate cyclase